jgi:hypothetical protein
MASPDGYIGMSRRVEYPQTNTDTRVGIDVGYSVGIIHSQNQKNRALR